MEIMGL